MHENYYTCEMMNEEVKPLIGNFLCADKSETLVRYTLPVDNARNELRQELLLEDFVKKKRELLDRLYYI